MNKKKIKIHKNALRYHEEVVVEGFRGRSRPLRILGYHSPTESHYEAKQT